MSGDQAYSLLTIGLTSVVVSDLVVLEILFTGDESVTVAGRRDTEGHVCSRLLGDGGYLLFVLCDPEVLLLVVEGFHRLEDRVGWKLLGKLPDLLHKGIHLSP